MQIDLSPELEAIINARVESGMYPSASEVVRSALSLLDHNEYRQRRIAEINHAIDIGLEQIARGEVVEPDELWAEMDEIIAKAEKNASKL